MTPKLKKITDINNILKKIKKFAGIDDASAFISESSYGFRRLAFVHNFNHISFTRNVFERNNDVKTYSIYGMTSYGCPINIVLSHDAIDGEMVVNELEKFAETYDLYISLPDADQNVLVWPKGMDKYEVAIHLDMLQSCKHM